MEASNTTISSSIPLQKSLLDTARELLSSIWSLTSPFRVSLLLLVMFSFVTSPVSPLFADLTWIGYAATPSGTLFALVIGTLIAMPIYMTLGSVFRYARRLCKTSKVVGIRRAMHEELSSGLEHSREQTRNLWDGVSECHKRTGVAREKDLDETSILLESVKGITVDVDDLIVTQGHLREEFEQLKATFTQGGMSKSRRSVSPDASRTPTGKRDEIRFEDDEWPRGSAGTTRERRRNRDTEY